MTEYRFEENDEEIVVKFSRLSIGGISLCIQSALDVDNGDQVYVLHESVVSRRVSKRFCQSRSDCSGLMAMQVGHD